MLFKNLIIFGFCVLHALPAHPERILPTEILTEERVDYNLAFISATTRLGPYQNYKYNYDSRAGKDSVVFMFSTGANIEDPDLDGRATLGPTFVSGYGPNGDVGASGRDEDGRGTFMAGIVLSVARKATLVSVKMAPQPRNILRAIEWLINLDRRPPRAVALFTFSGPPNSVLEYALKRLAASGVLITVSAGNSQAEPNNFPAGLDFLLTFASIGNLWDFDINSGRKFDLLAPGIDVSSSWYEGGQRIGSGPDVAAAHGAGLAAYIWSVAGDVTEEQLRFIMKWLPEHGPHPSVITNGIVREGRVVNPGRRPGVDRNQPPTV